jgi:hypothetical protein
LHGSGVNSIADQSEVKGEIGRLRARGSCHPRHDRDGSNAKKYGFAGKRQGSIDSTRCGDVAVHEF